MTIEEYLEKPCWVIDILPRQVPEDSPGQYFRIEEYYREHPQIDAIYSKFTNILLKLNCYEDIDVSLSDREHESSEELWATNPAPKSVEAMVASCLSRKEMLYVVLTSSSAMITISGDDTYMTIYNPSEAVLGLLAPLAASEGLFLWMPPQPADE